MEDFIEAPPNNPLIVVALGYANEIFPKKTSNRKISTSIDGREKPRMRGRECLDHSMNSQRSDGNVFQLKDIFFSDSENSSRPSYNREMDLIIKH